MIDNSYRWIGELKKVTIDEYEFTHSDDFFFMKGYLVGKRNSPTVYYRRIDTVGGVRFETNKRLMSSEVAHYKEKLSCKSVNRAKWREIQRRKRRVLKNISKCTAKGFLPADFVKETLDSLRNHLDFKTTKDPYTDVVVTGQYGEPMRSKAENAIADGATINRIHYNYEPEYRLIGATEADGYYDVIVRPDFDIFTKHFGVVHLEFFGMANDPDYMRRAEEKLEKYHQNGFIMGKNLVCMAALSSQSLNVRKISRVLKDIYNGLVPRSVVYV